MDYIRANTDSITMYDPCVKLTFSLIKETFRKNFKLSKEGEYTRFKAIYKIYSMLSDLGTHRDEGTVEKVEQSDALMCLRMTEDILIKFMMDLK